MDFKEFSLQVPKIKNLPLPGRSSHYKMAPELRVKELETQMNKATNPKRAGVMALFYPDDLGITHLLLIKRNSYPGVHSGQIGFPGGRVEKKDRDMLDTAIRETEEEVGAQPRQIEVVRSLSELYIPPSNFEVFPFMALYHKQTPFVAQASEVAGLVEVSLSDFMDDKLLGSQVLSTSYARQIEVPAFMLNGHTVWGATAMMLNEIRDLLLEVL